MPFVEANCVMLYYELGDRGERLLLVSGTGGDLRNQPRLADGPLGREFEVLAYDQRGLGQSDVPVGPYTMADYGDDAAALLDALRWDDCLVLGVSFGGMVAQELAIRHPERVRRLVLACTSAGGMGGASYPLHELLDVDPEELPARQLELIDTRWDAAWREANPDMARAVLETFHLRRPEHGGNDDGSPADAPRLGPLLQLEARRGHDTSDRLGAIRCPTLVCGGRYDGIAPPANAEFLARAIPGARLELFDGGHGFFLQDTAALPAIIAFLDGTDGRAAAAS